MLFQRSISGLVVFFGWALSIFAVGAQAEPVKVRMHQAWITGGKYAPMYVALEKGWYAKRNLSPVISRGYGSGRESKTLWKKQSDFAFEVDSTVMIRARAQGAKIKQVGMVYGKYPITMVSVINPKTGKPNVPTVKALEGKSLAFSPGSVHNALWPVFAKEAGIDAGKVRVVHMKGSEIYVPALLAGTVDATFGFYASEDAVAAIAARKAGKKLHFVSWGKAGPRFANSYANGMIARDEDIENRPRVVAGMVQETFRAFAYCMNHSEECVNILLKYHPVLGREVTTVQFTQILDAVLSPEAVANGLGYMKKSKMEYTTNLANELYKHNPPVKAEDVYTNRFVKKIRLPANFKRWSKL
ncbi:MAG: ABC transporter substrate-binding protein [Nitrospinota bacterium]|nr:ABC transporter substrate-binding protein [Nitrospinota bacterium]